jgi:hypothetical protein
MKSVHRTLSLAAGFGLLAALSLGVPAAAIAAETRAASGPTEGIKVHGRWTIDIKNPDGSLVSHHEFENALDSLGAVRLAELLARQKSPGVWGILLWQVGSGLRPPCPSYFNGACVIGETGSTDPEAQFKTMTISVPTSGPNQGKLVLAGSATAEADGDIAAVITQLGYCAGTVAAASCAAYRDSGFTRKDFQTPLVVNAGQIIQVTVVISFS